MRTTVPLQKGIRVALNYILDHPECQRDDPQFDAWCDKVIEVLENAKKAF